MGTENKTIDPALRALHIHNLARVLGESMLNAAGPIAETVEHGELRTTDSLLDSLASLCRDVAALAELRGAILDDDYTICAQFLENKSYATAQYTGDTSKLETRVVNLEERYKEVSFRLASHSTLHTAFMEADLEFAAFKKEFKNG